MKRRQSGIEDLEEAEIVIERGELKQAKTKKKKQESWQRVIIVHNPRSSQAGRVEREMIDPARKLKGCVVGRYAVQATNVSANAKRLAKLLTDGDLVVSAGGDGTATIAMNGAMLSGRKVALAVLPYGNFNDMARTFRVKDLKQAVNGKAVEVWPLEVMVNGKHWRYAMCYATAGMCAESAEIFDGARVRSGLQSGRGGLVFSLFELFKWWLKNRKRKFLGDFKLNGRKVQGMTDYFAVNGRYMAKVMEMPKSYQKAESFQSAAVKMSGLFAAIGFVGRAMMGRAKLVETDGDCLEFEKPRKVEIQAEGEYEKFEEVAKIEVRKAKRSIQVVRG